MTNYLTAPVLTARYDIRGDLMDEAWLFSRHSQAMTDLGWSIRHRLESVAYGLYLCFEEGRNIPPMVLAWRDHPEVDLANSDEVDGYPLHAVAHAYYRAEPAPELIARFHQPIADEIGDLALELAEKSRATLPRNPESDGAFLDLITNGAQRAAGIIFQAIETRMILRPAIYDRDGDPVGFGEDLAPGLVRAWENYFAQ